MDYESVNDLLGRFNVELERQELDDLRSYEIEGELETGNAPTSEDLDRIEEQYGYIGDEGTDSSYFSPDGDPIRGGEFGVDNLASDAEQYMSYVAELAVSVSIQTGLSDDDALNAVVAVADEMAQSGELPAMPDIETSPAEDLAQWTGAAKTSGLLSRVVSAIEVDTDRQNVTVRMGEPTGDAPKNYV